MRGKRSLRSNDSRVFRCTGGGGLWRRDRCDEEDEVVDEDSKLNRVGSSVRMLLADEHGEEWQY